MVPQNRDEPSGRESAFHEQGPRFNLGIFVHLNGVSDVVKDSLSENLEELLLVKVGDTELDRPRAI